ncbi:thiol:disulfide interchange protein DsbA/DsbL [Pseudoduganella eburnea]|uniref:Thiol:disulfide interchange protein n=1 Tax=Massilia eburnea TaxID=1776165 RepID=A0A6L6QKQ9_9BURK|nr:thiol:disulfide interchange protein DsbA/DsbL [Massilia eburnea]MTW12246.1 thiol:disulfide interchange protein DsbA/DsbL [Massilia eburnea]
MIKKFLALVLFGVSFAAAAAPAAPVLGTDYVRLVERQPVDTGKKVEVIEFFAYYCPHCYAFAPDIEAWARKQGDNIVFKRVHIGSGPSVLPQQKLFFSLESMGLLEQYHLKVFDAMHAQLGALRDDAAVMDWAAKEGIDKKRFAETYSGLGVSGKLRHADRMMGDYRVDYWPMVIIDGKYMTSPAQVNKGAPAKTEEQMHANALSVMDFLVAKAKSEKQ